MFKNLLGCLAIVSLSLGAFSKANAETVVLDNGQKIVGPIIERTELRIMMEVDGTPRTFFLGEIASIDGKSVSMPQDDKLTGDLAQAEKKIPVPYFGDEQESLVRFMNIRGGNVPDAATPAPVTPAAAPVATVSAPTANPAVAPSVDQTAASNSALATPGPNKAVVATPDGGIIVVDSNKITKYDKDFKVIKEVPLTTDTTANSPTETPPAAVSASPAPSVAPTPAPVTPTAAPIAPAASAPAASATSAPSGGDQSANSQPETLKDFLSNTVGSLFSSNKK